jgi:hypothetical protein
VFGRLCAAGYGNAVRFRAPFVWVKPNCNLVKLPLRVFFQNKIANKSVVAQVVLGDFDVLL